MQSDFYRACLKDCASKITEATLMVSQDDFFNKRVPREELWCQIKELIEYLDEIATDANNDARE